MCAIDGIDNIALLRGIVNRFLSNPKNIFDCEQNPDQQEKEKRGLPVHKLPLIFSVV
jgi:hypothetical protein